MYVCQDLTPKVEFLRAMVKDLMNDTPVEPTTVLAYTSPAVEDTPSFLKTYATLVAGIEAIHINLSCDVAFPMVTTPVLNPKPAYTAVYFEP
jgi:hypothetical protein